MFCKCFISHVTTVLGLRFPFLAALLLLLFPLRADVQFCVQVKFLDLTLPQYWLPRYDWVLSMEVLEHIGVGYETVVLDNIDRAAGHGAVLSWASPGQAGFHHVNNRPAEYLRKVMQTRGFRLDVPTSQKLRTVAKFPWLKRNLVVFYRQNPLQTTAI